MLTLPCVIFAGGKSSRMGEDKALLPFASYSTLTEYQYRRLSKIFQHIYISCKEPSNFSFDAKFIQDNTENEVYAPTAGFVAIFNELQTDSFFALSVDSPFIDEYVIKKIIEADQKQCDATIAKTKEGIQPLCGIYHRSLAPKFQQMLEQDNHKLGLLLKESKTNYCYFHDTAPFLNMNHPEDYQKALKLI